MKVLSALSLACAVALGGCAADGQHAVGGTPAPVVLTSTVEPAEAVASLLADADVAQGDPERLGMILAALDSFGARPMAGEADPVATWRSKAAMPKTPPYRGRVLGPAYKAGMLNPGATVRLPQLFDGGRSARVAVATPGQAGLDFTVLDGEAEITISGRPRRVKAGEFIIMPAHKPHALKAVKRYKMALIMIKA